MNTRNLAIVCALCLAAVPVSAAEVTLAVSPGAAGAPGSESDVPILLRDGRGLGSLQFELTYDPAVLEGRKVTAGPNMPAMLLEFHEVSPGRMRVALAGNEAMVDDGQLAVKFFVKSAGTSPLEIENARAWDQESGHDMLLLVESGQFDATAPAGGMMVWLAVIAAVVIVLLIVMIAIRRGGRRPRHAGQ